MTIDNQIVTLPVDGGLHQCSMTTGQSFRGTVVRRSAVIWTSPSCTNNNTVKWQHDNTSSRQTQTITQTPPLAKQYQHTTNQIISHLILGNQGEGFVYLGYYTMYIITKWALLKVGSSRSSIPGVMAILLYRV